MAEIDCRHFNGYKPCGKNAVCDSRCAHKQAVQTRILIIHLEALGAVLRSTALLASIHRKYPGAHVTWLTQKPADQLLKENPFIDRVMTVEAAEIEAVKALHFDVTFCIDKSLRACGLAAHIQSKEFFGFKLDRRTAAILPRSAAATELWELGLNDHKKFFENKKSETQLICEALELGPFLRDPYVLELNSKEQAEKRSRRAHWLQDKRWILGINTGCSEVIAYKKLSVEYHRKLIAEFADESCQIVLLGGREDDARNRAIAEGLHVIQSPTSLGLRDGIVSVAACDVVLTGDSLGMHIAIALQKQTVAWFGPTCEHEIDIYDRGAKLLSSAPCAPCWKRSCQKQVMCYDLVDRQSLRQAIVECKNRLLAQPEESNENSRSADGLHW